MLGQRHRLRHDCRDGGAPLIARGINGCSRDSRLAAWSLAGDRHLSRGLLALFGMLIVALALPAVGFASAGPPVFGAPSSIDGSTGSSFTGISCADTPAKLCVAVSGTDFQTSTTVGSATPTWSKPAVIPGAGSISGVSCPTSNLCVAADRSGNVLVSQDPGAATPSWTVSSAGLGLGFVTYPAPLLGVSCTADPVCTVWIALDGGVGPGEGETPLEPSAFVSTNITAANPTWTMVAEQPGPGLLPSNVSCADDGGNPECVGIGQPGAGRVATLADPGSATPEWSPLQYLFGYDSPTLTAVSCATGGVCVVVDGDGNAFVSTNFGSSWSAAIVIDPGESLTGVSCMSGGVCVALDTNGNAVVSSADAASWGKPALVDPVPSETPQVSCTGVGVCVAVDQLARAAISTDVGVDTPASWSTPAPIDGSEDLTGVSCAAGGVCAAVDRDGNATVSTTNGSGDQIWSAAAAVDAGHALTGVSCASGGLCVGVDDRGDAVVSSNAGGASSTWSPPFTVDAGHALSGVSCDASGGLCVAVDNDGGAVISTTPATSGSWQRVTIDGSHPLTGVSCPVAGLCAVTDSAGSVLVSTTAAPGVSSGWASFSVDAGNVLSAVSCTSSGLCVAVDQSGDAVTSTNASGTTPTWSSPTSIDPGQVLTSVSCASDGSCLAGDAAGGAVFSNGAGSGTPGWAAIAGISNPAPVNGASCTDSGLCVMVDGADGFALVGQRSTSAVSVTPSPGALPDTVVGSTSAPQTFTITDGGGGTLNISQVAISGADASEFVLSNNGCDGAAVAPTQTCTLDIAFSPTSAGAQSDANLVITSDAPSSPDDIALSGTGTEPAVSISPASGGFPATVVGATSAVEAFTITNGGSGMLNISQVALVGSDSGQFDLTDHGCTGASLASGGAGCTVDIAFAPTSSGLHSDANLVVTSNDPAGLDDFALSGTGTLPAASVSVSPASGAFAATGVGSTGAPKTFTVTNTGTATLHIQGATLAGADPGQFTSTDHGCGGAAIAPGAACSVAVTFTPTSPGAQSASLQIQSDASSGLATVALTGTGIAATPITTPTTTPTKPLVTPSNVVAVATKLHAKGVLALTLKLPDAGSVTVSSTARIPRTKSKKTRRARAASSGNTKSIIYASRVSRTTAGPGDVSVTIRPTKSAATALKSEKKLTVSIAISFTPTNGVRRTKTITVTVKSG